MFPSHRRAHRTAAQLTLEALEPRYVLNSSIEFSQPIYYFDHNAPTATFTLIRNGDPSGSTWVQFVPENGTAILQTDYDVPIGNNDIITFGDGVTSETVNLISILPESTPEANRTFGVLLQGGPAGLTIGPQSTATMVLVSDAGSAAFLNRAYLDLVGATVDSGSAHSWSVAFAAGVPRATFIQEVTQGAAYGSYTVQDLYQDILGRTPSPAEINGWIPTYTADPYAVEDISAALLGSTEFFNDSYQTNAGFLSALYVDVLGRSIDTGGLASWSQLLAGGVSRQQVALDLLRSPEADAHWVNWAYTNYLHRTADSGGETNFVNALQQGAPYLSVISDLMGSDEYFNDVLGGRQPVPNTAGGLLDPTFGVGGTVVTPFAGASSQVAAIAVQADQKLVVAGTVGSEFALARYNTSGSLDATFGSSGLVGTSFPGGASHAAAVAIQSDGKIVVGGYVNTTPEDFALARYNPNGTLDSTFGSGGQESWNIASTGNDQITSLAVLANGQIVVAGPVGSNFALERLNANGTVDTTFGSSGVALSTVSESGPVAMKVDPSGNFVVAGTSASHFLAARFLPTGKLDTTFAQFSGTPGEVLGTTGSGDAVALEPNGNIVVAGSALVQFTASGVVNTSFGSNGVVPVPSVATITAVQTDLGGNIIAAGLFSINGGENIGGGPFSSGTEVARLGANGQLDSSFGGTGVSRNPDGSTPEALAFQGSKYVVAGTSAVQQGTTSFEVSQYLSLSPNQLFVWNLYVDLLGRVPDGPGLYFWSSLLDAGNIRPFVVYEIEHSTEYLTDEVQQAYQTILGRTPDPGGQAGWVSALANGLSSKQLEAALLGSGEFYHDAGGTNADLVNALYEQILHRTPDAGGLASWVQQLNQGVSAVTVATDILDSQELDTTEAEVQYSHFLKAPVDPNTLNAIVQQMLAGTADETIALQLAASDAYFARY
jgi:uncharacterized delta-60 repeat protein